MRAVPLLSLAILLLQACGDDGAAAPDQTVEAIGPHAVGVQSVTIEDRGRGRGLPMLIFFPAEPPAAPDAGLTIELLEDEPHHSAYARLLDLAPAGCPSRALPAMLGGTVAAGSFPLIAVSHCHECTRFSTATIAIRLASHGFVVAAVDHVGNTLWNQLAGDGVALDTDFLAVRAADIRFTIDETLRAGSTVPAAVQAAIDPERIGVLGHSFGAVTAGVVVQDDPRVDAAFALAAPMENPLLPGVTIAAIAQPLGFLVAAEDNSITELGNQLIRNNFEAAVGGAWKIELADAGHWSVSDLVGVVPGFMAGCGAGTRQTDGQAFTYTAPAPARSLAAAYVTAFFKATLEDDAGAEAYLTHVRTDGAATVAGR